MAINIGHFAEKWVILQKIAIKLGYFAENVYKKGYITEIVAIKVGIVFTFLPAHTHQSTYPVPPMPQPLEY